MILKVLMKILIKIYKNLTKICIFFLLSILIAGWGVGCFPSFANFLGFWGGGVFPVPPIGDAIGYTNDF